MSASEIAQSPNNDAVKLLIERDAARELYGAVRLAAGYATVSGDTGASQYKSDDAHMMIVRKRSAIELLNALALNLNLEPAPIDSTATQNEDDAVEIIVSKPTAVSILNSLMLSLGAEESAGGNDDGQDKEGIVEVIVGKLTAIDILNSLVINLGGVPDGKGKKAGKGRGGNGWPGVEDGTTAPPPLEKGIDSTSVADEVDCTVYAPGQASPGNTFLVQVFAHLPEQATALEQIAKEAAPTAKRRVGQTLDQKIQRGSRLAFNMTMRDLEIDEPSQSIIWNGKPDAARFFVTVPEGFKPRDIGCTIVVSENTIPIGHLKFIFKVVAPDAAPASDNRAVPAAGLIRYQQAFISYASADRAEVLKRVQMLNASRVSFFQDLLTLEPGDRWEKLLYDYIDKSDVFFLFWSKAASESQWVGKEIAYARERQAGSAESTPEIIPILIEGPPPAKPPEQLSFLHFNDKFLYFIKAEEEMADA